MIKEYACLTSAISPIACLTSAISFIVYFILDIFRAWMIENKE